MPTITTPTNPTGTRLPFGQLQSTEISGFQGERLLSELHPKYFTQATNGNLWHALSAVGGAAVPIANTVAPVCTIWNPVGSGVNVVLAQLAMGYVSGTGAPGAVHLGYTLNAGASVATAAPFSVFTHVDPTAAIIGNNYTGRARFAPATATLTAAGTQGPVTGLSWLTTTATDTNGTSLRMVDFDGKFVIKPGVAVYPLAVAASVTLFTMCWTFYEVPV